MIRIPTRREGRGGKLDQLKALPVFAGLPRKTLEDLAQNLDEASVEAGEVILREGHHNDTFWIILEGSLDLDIAEGAHLELGPQAIIGLPSGFLGRESVVTVTTRTPVRALVASHSQFNHFIGDPEIEIRFKAAVFDRMRDELHQVIHAVAAGRPPAAVKGAAAATAGGKASAKKPTNKSAKA